MNAHRTMLLELSTGRMRPMRSTAPLHSSAARPWDGFLVEEHPPAEWASNNVLLVHNAVYLTLDAPTHLEWRGGAMSVSRRLNPGRVSILPANHPYSVRLRAGGGSIVVSLQQKLLACAAAEQGEFGDVQPVWVHGVEDKLVRELVLSLREEVRRPDCHNPGYAQSLASTLAAHIVRRYSTDQLRAPARPGGLSISILRSAIRFILAHLGQEISLADLAANAGLSTGHFARMFKQSTGRSPHVYVLHCRVARAKELLRNRSHTLAEVAARAGFCDQAHLSRAFRQLLGTTPGSYARGISFEPGEL